jgi:hypothetical protein
VNIKKKRILQALTNVVGDDLRTSQNEHELISYALDFLPKCWEISYEDIESILKGNMAEEILSIF